jgi:hypothetical protein
MCATAEEPGCKHRFGAVSELPSPGPFPGAACCQLTDPQNSKAAPLQVVTGSPALGAKRLAFEPITPTDEVGETLSI